MIFNMKEFEENFCSSLEKVRRLDEYKDKLEREKNEAVNLINNLNEKIKLLTTKNEQLKVSAEKIKEEFEEKRLEEIKLNKRLEEELEKSKRMVPIKEYQNILEMNGRLLYLAQSYLREESNKVEDLSSNKNIELLDGEGEKVILAQKKEIEELKVKNTKLTNNFTEIYQSENEKTLEIMRLNREISNLKKELRK